MKHLIQLMQDVQEYGQPPSDIIQDIAPGIELDDNGLPKMNTSSNHTGIPSPFGNDTEECLIM
jgi:Pex19 protein family